MMLNFKQQPQSNVYRTDRCLETIRHAKRASVLFIWMKVSTLRLPALSNVSSCHVLLRFMDKYIRSGDYNRFNLLSLSYKLGASGSFGVLIFDNKLRKAYKQARTQLRR
ncbi:hypothetical protein B0H14DRAFT_2700102 [Mycena olivaceomarginata]|nr:hypothetical protein B0H14DRAFT_2770329 [Mycena olivaceomarginata]KAJ7884752.1 hypothetical protein B0H14DRAFT_2700102 [Mycena olivaceomarginata]